MIHTMNHFWYHLGLPIAVGLLALQGMVVTWLIVTIRKQMKKQAHLTMQTHAIAMSNGMHTEEIQKTIKSIDTKIYNGRKRDVRMHMIVMNVLEEVKKGNKDQQEIKTKLTNLRQLDEKILIEAQNKVRMEITPKKSKTKRP